MDSTVPDQEPEFALIAACASVRRRGPDDVTRHLSSELDWTKVLSLAGRHGLLATLHARLDDLPAVPAAVHTYLTRHATQNAERNRRLLAALRAILRALHGRAVEAIPLRSAWLVSPAHEIVDVDLLVRRQDLSKVERTLDELGFRPERDMTPAELEVVRRTGWARRFVDVRGTVVSVQWAVLPQALRHGVSLEELWHDRRHGWMDERPATAHLLQLLCLRGTAFRWHRLRWIREVALALAESRPDDLMAAAAQAETRGGLRALRLGALLASTLLAAPAGALAEDAARDATCLSLARETVTELARPTRRLPTTREIARYQQRARERTRDRLAYVVRRAVTPTPQDAHAASWLVSVSGLLAVARPLRVIATAWRTRRYRRRKHPGQLVRFNGTPPHIVDRMLVLAGLTADDTVCDIGCGDGGIVVHAAVRTGCRAIGIDVDPELVAAARVRACAAGVADRVTFVCADVRGVDLSAATVVTLYLNAAAMMTVRPLLQTQLRTGARIVSRNFDMADWPPDAIEVIEEGAWGSETLYLWRLGEPTGPVVLSTASHTACTA